MKKGLWICFIAMAVLVFSVSAANAQDSVVETPDVKIVIKGERVEFKDVLLSQNQRTMLPVRELLVNLGVENDDEHIIWNGKEKSVTVYKDDIKIVMQIGNKVAYVNGKPVILDAAPLGYRNQRVYIPARFVAQTLGKKVVWDGKTKTVFIRDADEFNSVKEILEKSNKAMDGIKKLKITTDMEVTLDTGKDTLERFNIGMKEEADKSKGILRTAMNLPLLGREVAIESYLAENAVYNKSPLTGKWERKELKEDEFKSLLDENIRSMVLQGNDVLYAGLKAEESPEPGMILLKGSVYPASFIEMINKKTGIGKYNVDEYHIELLIDKETGLVHRMDITIGGKLETGSGEYGFKSVAKCVYSDFDGEFEVTEPEGLR